VKVSDLVARLGPIFGLLGTLIPLGPGIIAMGQGDTYTLSRSLLTAFDTTILGLISAAVAMVVSMIRRGWYGNYMSALEAVMECVLEVEKTDVGQALEQIEVKSEAI
jgi:biopolymer transport protein ExbB/TolQ